MSEMLSMISEKLVNVAAETLDDCISIGEKMQALKYELQNLTNQETGLLAFLEDEEIRSGRKRKREVEDWIADVKRKKTVCENLEQEVQHTRFYNFQSNLRLGKLIKKTRFEVQKLTEASKFADGFFLEACKTKGTPIVITRLEGQHTLEKNALTVWPWLMDDVDAKIGIHGMGGVGKSTLAMRIHNKLLTDPKFRGHVYWIQVSQESNISKLQNDIAIALKLDMSSEDNEQQRAARLFAALKRRKRFALILDDVWSHISTEKIGIPLGSDGSKLLITSRSIDVCHKMGCQKNLKVNVLGEEEAWELFLDKLGCGNILPPDTKPIAREVAKRCSGLPLGIITMSGSMRGVTDVHEWRDALEELNESSMGPGDMGTEVFPILLCSFNRLRDPKLQSCFLYCSLYPKDYSISRDELISKFIVEELMDKRKNRHAYFDQGHAILNKLENASLLERADYNSVKMHDLIRDMGVKLNNSNFMVKSGLQLRQLPEEHEWEAADKVSLMCNKISNISPCMSFKCYRLATLILQRNPLERLHNSFFLHMHALQVLDLSYTWIENLPNSVSDLENLNSLLLSCCHKLKYIPPLNKLKRLKELELNKTQIEELPAGMRNLVNLKSVNIGYMNRLKMIPEGMLTELSLLQRLIISDNLKVRGEELEGLEHLEEFQGVLIDVHDLNKLIISQQKFGKLKFYSIVVGKHDDWSRDHPESKRLTEKLLTFKGCCFNTGRGGQERVLLPKDIQDLKIAKCNGLNNSLSDVFASLNALKTLKSLRISNCDDIKCIARMSSSVQAEGGQEYHMPFQSVEKIILSWMCSLTSLIKWDIVSAAPLIGTFTSLKELRVEFCNKIKTLFTFSVLKCLHNLEDVYVSECAEMEEILGDGEEYSSEHAVFCLPKLKSISLKWLPQLKSICMGVLKCDSIEVVGLFQCRKLRKLPLFLPHVNGQSYPHHTLKQIRIGKGDQEWWESLEFNHPMHKKVLTPFVKCLNLGLQASLLDPGWKQLFCVFLFIKRLRVRTRYIPNVNENGQENV